MAESLVPPRALSHPLPAGMRDLLPAEARRRRALAACVMEHFALHGYHLVTLPAFELADVLERGLGALDPSDVLRFIEPESGEVAALRPDMTPQIARMVATRLAHEPSPLRLAYEGTIVRRRQGRARRHRQVPQAGVELYGSPSVRGDLEILRLASSTLRALGLDHAVIDIGHARIARSLIERLPAALGAEVGDALGQKDVARVRDLVADEDPSLVPPSLGKILAELAELHGGEGGSADALFARGERLFAGTAAAAPLRELKTLWDQAIRDPALAEVLRVDLGNLRGFAYYTGVIFDVLAPGPGEPIGGGGRYDELLARFDAPMPAIGFALHLDSVAWARRHAGIVEPRPPRVLVAPETDLASSIVDELRRRGVAAAAHAEDGAVEYALAWEFTDVVVAGEKALEWIAVDPEKRAAKAPVPLGSRDPIEVASRFSAPTITKADGGSTRGTELPEKEDG